VVACASIEKGFRQVRIRQISIFDHGFWHLIVLFRSDCRIQRCASCTIRTALRALINCTDIEPIIQCRARHRARRRALIERLHGSLNQSNDCTEAKTSQRTESSLLELWGHGVTAEVSWGSNWWYRWRRRWILIDSWCSRCGWCLYRLHADLVLAMCPELSQHLSLNSDKARALISARYRH
jgi:hypothetical protein